MTSSVLFNTWASAPFNWMRVVSSTPLRERDSMALIGASRPVKTVIPDGVMLTSALRRSSGQTCRFVHPFSTSLSMIREVLLEGAMDVVQRPHKNAAVPTKFP